MDLWNVLRSAVRYWYLTALVLIASLLLSTAWLSRIEPMFEADATVLIVGPRELAATTPNPFLASGGSLTTTARAVEVAVGSPATRSDVRALGLEPEYLVAAETREPLLRIDVANGDAEVTMSTLEKVIGLIEGDLLARQDSLSVAPSQRVRVQILSADSVAAENDRGRARAGIALFGLSILLAVLLAHAFDLVRGRSKARRGQTTDLPRRHVPPERPSHLQESPPDDRSGGPGSATPAEMDMPQASREAVQPGAFRDA